LSLTWTIFVVGSIGFSKDALMYSSFSGFFRIIIESSNKLVIASCIAKPSSFISEFIEDSKISLSFRIKLGSEITRFELSLFDEDSCHVSFVFLPVEIAKTVEISTKTALSLSFWHNILISRDSLRYIKVFFTIRSALLSFRMRYLRELGRRASCNAVMFLAHKSYRLASSTKNVVGNCLANSTLSGIWDNS